MESSIILSDLHYPAHDPKYINIATKLIKILNPDNVIQIGDALDSSGISSYLTDPKSESRLYKEIEMYNDQLDKWSSIMKKGSTFHQLSGNHSQRLERFIAKNCREIHEIVPTIPELLRIKERNKGPVKFKWHPLNNWKSCKIGDAYIHHGVYYDKNLAVSNLARYGVKFLQGHSHSYQTAYNGKIWSVTLGHGSIAEKTAHIHGPNSWQQAMGIIWNDNGESHFEPIIINNGETCFRGKIIKG